MSPHRFRSQMPRRTPEVSQGPQSSGETQGGLVERLTARRNESRTKMQEAKRRFGGARETARQDRKDKNALVKKMLDEDTGEIEKAGITGNKRQKERGLRKLLFDRDIDRLDRTEQRLVKGVARAYGVKPTTLAGLRDLGIDGFGHAYETSKKTNWKEHIYEMEAAAEALKGKEGKIRRVLRSDATEQEKKDQIHAILQQDGQEGLLDRLEDVFEGEETPEVRKRREQYLPKSRAAQLINRPCPAPKKLQESGYTRGYSRGGPSRSMAGGGSSTPSQVEPFDAKALDKIGEGSGKTVVKAVQEALSNGSVRGAHCWDWCEKIYAKAGARRQNLYSNFKTGRNDRSAGYHSRQEIEQKIPGGVKPGDWLFVKNHNSADDFGNHSVIFLGWNSDNSIKTACCPRSGSTGHIASYNVADCPIVWVSRAA